MVVGRSGRHLRGSPDPRYQRWIDTYADSEESDAVAVVFDLGIGRVGLIAAIPLSAPAILFGEVPDGPRISRH